MKLRICFNFGCIGFIKAIKNFKFELDNKLSTYATYMIIGEIKRFLRDNGPIKVSRSLKEIAGKVRELQEKNQKEKGEELTLEEVSRILQIDKEDIVLALDATAAIDSIDRNIGEGDDYTIGDKIASKKDEYEKVVNGIAISNVIDMLEENEKKVIFFRYYREMTQSQIATFLGTSQVQVSRIEKRALKKMHDKLSV